MCYVYSNVCSNADVYVCVCMYVCACEVQDIFLVTTRHLHLTSTYFVLLEIEEKENTR